VQQESGIKENHQRRVVFVVESPFSLRDEERFGVKRLLEAGFLVEAWEIAPITLPRSEDQWFEPARHVQITRFTEFTVFAEAARALSDRDALITFVAVSGERLFPPRRLMAALCATPAVFGAIWHSIAFNVSLGDPRMKSLPPLSRLKHRLKSYSKNLAEFLFGIPCLGPIFRRTMRRLLRMRPLDFAWVATDGHGLHPLLVSDGCRLRVIHSFDLEETLGHSGKAGSREGFGLLVDGMGPLHPDHTTLGMNPELQPEEFFMLVNRALDEFSVVTSVGVQVAAHPRAEPGTMEVWYPDRQVRYAETAEAMADASHIIFYYPSTLISLAVAMKKPIVMIRSDNPGFYDEMADALIDRLNLNVIALEDNVAVAQFRAFDERAYEDFERQHVGKRDEDSRSFWDIVACDLNNT